MSETLTLPLAIQQRLADAGAAIWGDGTVMAPRGVDEPQIVMDEAAAEAALARWAAITAQDAIPQGIEERNALAIAQTTHLLRLLEDCNWNAAQRACRLLCGTLGIETA